MEACMRGNYDFSEPDCTPVYPHNPPVSTAFCVATGLENAFPRSLGGGRTDIPSVQTGSWCDIHVIFGKIPANPDFCVRNRAFGGSTSACEGSHHARPPSGAPPRAFPAPPLPCVCVATCWPPLFWEICSAPERFRSGVRLGVRPAVSARVG